MNALKNLKAPLIVLLVAATFMACSDDDNSRAQNDGYGRLGIYAKASYFL